MVCQETLAAAQFLDGERARPLPALAAIPDPRAPGDASPARSDPGLGGLRGAGRQRSFTAIAEWAADADLATREALGVAGLLCGSARRSLGRTRSQDRGETPTDEA